MAPFHYLLPKPKANGTHPVHFESNELTGLFIRCFFRYNAFVAGMTIFSGTQNRTRVGVARFLPVVVILGLVFSVAASASVLLIPMDESQPEHCRGYGLVYQALEKNVAGVSWLLNYRGGSFLLPSDFAIRQQAEKMGVKTELLQEAELQAILALIGEENMDVVPLEKAPRIGIYLAGSGEESHDVVARTLRYSGIPFTTIYDGEILDGKLSGIDWLHIHHKDFTGQGHKRMIDGTDRELAARKGFAKVWEMKHKVSETIRSYVNDGGFLFAMCSAAETIDVALAAKGVDIVAPLFDGDPPDPQANAKLDFSRTFAFADFHVITGFQGKYSDIDVPTAGENTRFDLFEFSAAVDPVPCLLNQNHHRNILGFSGETSSFRRSLIKRSITILADNNDGVSTRYLCGYVGKGVFSFYGGHAPGMNKESFRILAPGFRLILNNVLFPSAKTRKRKT
jgi:hypothetical protein